MDQELVEFAIEAAGDAQWLPPDDLLDALRPMQWRGPDQGAAAALIRWWYWEPRVPAAERRFYPGGTSQVGFLAWGEDLGTILAADGSWLVQAGCEPRYVGERLKAVLDAGAVTREWHFRRLFGDMSSIGSATANDGHSEPRLAIDNLAVGFRAYRGFQRCPFLDCLHSHPRQRCPHSGVDFQLMHPLGELNGRGIAWHLIAAHGFFGGPCSPYRIDPDTLCSLLDIVPLNGS